MMQLPVPPGTSFTSETSQISAKELLRKTLDETKGLPAERLLDLLNGFDRAARSRPTS